MIVQQGVARTTGRNAADALRAVVAERGALTHRFVASDACTTGAGALRTLADVVHHLGMLHGLAPGVADPGVDRAPSPRIATLSADISAHFAQERAFLARLTVAAGPMPSTPGHAESETAMLAQVHALRMLATSERAGVAAGAALALVLDWEAIHVVLDRAATRLGVATSSRMKPLAIDDALADLTDPAVRALRFGAEQLIEAHRATWSLLEARAEARAML